MYKAAYFQDGLIDIFMGFALFANSIGPFFYDMGIPVPWNYFILTGPAYLLLLYVKKKIITPRLGLVKFSDERKFRKKKAVVGAIVGVSITAICVLLTSIGSLNPGINKYVDIILMGMVAFVIPIGILAYLLDFFRMYVFGFIALLAWLMLVFIDKRIPSPYDWMVSFGSMGIIFMIVGAVLFVRFLKKYPLPQGESAAIGFENGR